MPHQRSVVFEADRAGRLGEPIEAVLAEELVYEIEVLPAHGPGGPLNRGARAVCSRADRRH